MNQLRPELRAKIIHLLCECNSIRAITRLTGVSKTTITKLLVDVGKACEEYQDHVLRALPCKRVQVDEIWSFCYAKNKNLPPGKAGGDVWTWTAIDPDSKLAISWLVGTRESECANAFMLDLKSRLDGRVQLTADRWKPYPEAVENAFGDDIDFAQLVKSFNTGDPKVSKAVIVGNPDPKAISTSLVERQNLTMRTHIRRFTRRTNAFSKKIDNHAYAVALHFMYYNFVKVHQTLRFTPAMAAGVTQKLWEIGDIVKLLGSN